MIDEKNENYTLKQKLVGKEDMVGMLVILKLKMMFGFCYEY